MLLVSAFTSALFALGIYVAAERLERTVLNRHIRAEFDALAAGLEERPHTDSIRSALLVGYVGQDNPALPAEFAALPPGGYHAVRVGEKAYQVYVGETAGSRLYVAYDISEWEALERPVIYVLIAGVVMSSLAAVWIGFRAASQVIAPVTALAQRLKALDPRERNVRLGREFTGAEVATIAEAFDRYMERLDGFVEREQLFTSAAAHELRTPLAVMRGAVDVLLEQPDLSARARRAVERVERATREMHEFIEALLFLSRETRRDEEERAGCEFRTIVWRAMAAKERPSPSISDERSTHPRLRIPVCSPSKAPADESSLSCLDSRRQVCCSARQPISCAACFHGFRRRPREKNASALDPQATARDRPASLRAPCGR